MKSKRNKPIVFTDLSDPGDAGEMHDTPELGPATRPSIRPPSPEHVAAMEAIEARGSRKAGRDHGKAVPASRARAESEPASWARFAYPIAAAASLAWAGGLVAFVLGFQTQFGAFDYGTLQWVVIGVLAALPALFILLAAAAVRQGASLASETRRARALADDLAIPAALAADQTGGAMDAMRREIERASAAAVSAQLPIAHLREAIAEESRKLAQTAADAQEAGRNLAETLGRERVALSDLADALQAQTAEAVEALTMQTRLVSDTSDLAQAQLQEAQAALAARAADLAVAAGDASEAALTASAQLTQQVERLESTGGTITERLNRLQLSVARERDELSALSEGLRLDQEDMSVQMETRRAQLTQAALDAREGSIAINRSADTTAETLRGLIATAAEEVARLADSAHREQAMIEAQARDAFNLLANAAGEERAGLEAQTREAIEQLAAAADEARRAAEGHIQAASRAASEHADAARAKLDMLADTATSRIDNLGEAAFAAAQKADEIFDMRLASARRLIDQSVSLVEESGQRSAEVIEVGLASARSSLEDMQDLLALIDSRFQKLPEDVRGQAEAVRAAVEQGVGDLTAAARRAAEETQAIDAAFQERVRRNYEVLSEAVRLMGRVAGAAAVPVAPEAAAVTPVQTPVAPIRPPEPAPEAVAERAPVEVRPAIAVGERSLHVPMGEATAARGDALRPAALAEPIPAVRAAPEPASAASAGLRPRLRLTPAPAEDLAASMFEPREPAPPRAEPEVRAASPAPAPPAKDDDHPTDQWTWKDLLSSMDEPVDEEALAERMMGEISALGIDAAALLPRSRIDEIAAVMQAGDSAGAREVVRRLAPAAVRRLSRRVLTDKVLRAEADRYVSRYEALLGDAVARDREGFMTAALLGSEPGRAFLLLDAAIGDLV